MNSTVSSKLTETKQLARPGIEQIWYPSSILVPTQPFYLLSGWLVGLPRSTRWSSLWVIPTRSPTPSLHRSTPAYMDIWSIYSIWCVVFKMFFSLFLSTFHKQLFLFLLKCDNYDVIFDEVFVILFNIWTFHCNNYHLNIPLHYLPFDYSIALSTIWTFHCNNYHLNIPFHYLPFEDSIPLSTIWIFHCTFYHLSISFHYLPFEHSIALSTIWTFHCTIYLYGWT